MLGQLISHYLLTEHLGSGSFGEVWKGVHVDDPAFAVAVKLVHPTMQREPGFIAALRRECQILDRLDHPGVVRFRDLVVRDGVVAMVLELLQGEDLEAALQAGPQPVPEVVRILEMALEGLAYAHGQGLVHRDIKPANVYRCRDGRVKLMDFGLARAVEGSQGTHTGVVKGTMDYVAAERFGGTSGPPADVYALGLVAWEMLAGRRAAPQGELAAKIGWHLMTGPGDVRAARPDCPAWLAELLLAMTAREVAPRPADGAAALGELRRLRAAWAVGGPAGRPPPAPPTVEVKVGGGGKSAAPGPRPAPPPTVQHRAVPRPGPPSTPPQAPGARRLVQGRAQGPFGFEMAYIPAGRFVMGSPPDEAGRSPEEVQHEVVLTRPFEIGVVPVTQGLYKAVMGMNPSSARGLMRPVEGVSWFDAVALCNALSAALGLGEVYVFAASQAPDAGWIRRLLASQSLPGVVWQPSADGFRLPTEAEWEYAARAGGRQVYAGSNDVDAVGWTSSSSGGETHVVGEKQPNAWGLHDMTGNVWEWCWDFYGSYSGPSTDPVGAQTGLHRVIRGGSWDVVPPSARVAGRNGDGTGRRGNNLGLRVARTIP